MGSLFKIFILLCLELEYSKMKNLIILLLIELVLGEECCKEKEVGGVNYRYLGKEDTTAYSCVDKCAYMKEGEENSKYCFADGDMEPKCKDAGATAGQGGGGVAGPTQASGGGVGATTSSSGASASAGCKCGVKRTSRIVGGTLIASQWILTAAHCMFKDSAGTQPQTAAEI